MKPSKFKMAALASAVLMCAAAGSAHAGSYAVAYLNIQDFTINQAPVGSIAFGQSVDSSTASAILNGIGAGPNGGTGVSDAQIAVRGTTAPPVSNNSQFGGGLTITPIGRVGQTDYSYADALITHNPVALNVFSAQTIAESHLANPGTASALAENKSSTGFTTTLDAAAGSTIDFAFSADPRISLFLQTSAAGIGSFATGSISAKLTITCTNTGGCGSTAGGVAINDGDVVFSWSPNGVVNDADITGKVGGDEQDDGENLQVGRSLNGPPGGALDYSLASTLSLFHAVTNPLGAGTYTLQLDMNSSDGVIKAAVVPEPGTVALLGLGLAGLAMTSRRRKV
jgi:hypothetical protein